MSDEIKNTSKKEPEAFKSMYSVKSIDELNWKLGDPRITIIFCTFLLAIVYAASFGYLNPAFSTPIEEAQNIYASIVIALAPIILVLFSIKRLMAVGFWDSLENGREMSIAEMHHYNQVTYTVDSAGSLNLYAVLTYWMAINAVQSATPGHVLQLVTVFISLSVFIIIFIKYSRMVIMGSSGKVRSPLQYVVIQFHESLAAVCLSALFTILSFWILQLPPHKGNFGMGIFFMILAISDALQTRKVRNQLLNEEMVEVKV